MAKDTGVATTMNSATDVMIDKHIPKLKHGHCLIPNTRDNVTSLDAGSNRNSKSAMDILERLSGTVNLPAN